MDRSLSSEESLGTKSKRGNPVHNRGRLTPSCYSGWPARSKKKKMR